MKILLAGEGGQGIQSVAEILGKTAHKQGKIVLYMPSFGVEQRGGVSLAFLQINDKPISYPKFSQADILVAMSDRAITKIKSFLTDESQLIFDGSFISDQTVQSLQGKVKKYLNLPAREIALRDLSSKVTNIVFLGALLKFLPELDLETVKKTIEEKFARYIAKKPELKDLNFKALETGLGFAKNPQNQELKGLEKPEIQREFSDEKKTWSRFPEYCKGCGICLVRCPVKALSFSKDLNFLGTPLPQVDLAKCTACGLCQQACPDGAILVVKKQS